MSSSVSVVVCSQTSSLADEGEKNASSSAKFQRIYGLSNERFGAAISSPDQLVVKTEELLWRGWLTSQ
jgi:hypothetical protein